MRRATRTNHRPSESPCRCQVSGDIRRTDATTVLQILCALFERKDIRVKSESELFIENEDLSFNLYEFESAGRNERSYLVGGWIYQEYDQAYRICCRLAKELERRELVYLIELEDRSLPPKDQHVRFSSRVE